MEKVDLIIETDAVLPMTDDSVIYDAMVAVDTGRIVYVGPVEEGRARFTSEQLLGGPHTVLMPGLVNAHTHVGIHFFGTLCNDGNLITALYQLLFPMEFHLDEEMMYTASSIGIWDALRGGVTTVCDHFHFPDATAAAASELGLRGLVAGKIIEFELNAAPDYDAGSRTYDIKYVRHEAERRLAENVSFIERWRGHPLVTPCLGPHAPDTLSTEMLIEAARTADALDVKMMMHIAQSAAEVNQVRQKGYSGSIHYLDEIGFLSPRVQAAHMIFLDDEEISKAAASGMSCSFNPISNIWTYSFGPFRKLVESGIGIGFGTDACSMDELEEMRYAILATNYLSGGDDVVLPAYKLLRMATIDGARCLGLDAEIGSVEAGKKADLIILDLRDGQLIPNTNYHETVAYYAKSRNLTHTIVDGRVVYANGKLQLGDEERMFHEATRLSRRWVALNRDTLERRGIWHRIQPHFFADGPPPSEAPLIGRGTV